MLFTIITTTECNFHCRYCGGKLPGMPTQISYSLTDLYEFINKDKNPIIAFYGGEPLLKIDTIKKMIDILPAKRFILTTNGTNIEELGDYINRVDTILLSIDGRQEVTDYYRGMGSTLQVLHALDFLKHHKYSGEIIGRMTVSCKTDIYEDVKYLLSLFPYVHWQLDAVWSKIWDLVKFRKWVEKSYKPGLLRLIDFWVNKLEDNQILGIVPFLGMMSRILNGKGDLPCQAGTEAVVITTDGKILACPIAPEFTWNVLGDFNSFNKIVIGEPCCNCDIYRICGGRCLFAYKERLWGKEGFSAVCDTTRFLVDELSRYKDKCISIKDKIFYPPYNNTTEIIP